MAMKGLGRGLFGSGLIALAMAASGPASAQFFQGPDPYERGYYLDQPPAPPPRVIQRRLQRQGYSVVGPMRLNGDVVIAEAVGPDGRRMRLVVDPQDGAIIERFARAEPRPPINLRPRDEFDDDDDEPRVLRAPIPRLDEDGALEPRALPRPDAPTANAPTAKPKPKPKVVAKTSPPAPLAAPLPAPEAAPRAPLAKAAPKPTPTKAAPESSSVARTAPAEVTRPVVSLSAARKPTATVEATAPRATPSEIQSAAPQTEKPAPTPAIAEPTNPPAAAPKPDFANGVPINPLD